MTEIVKEEEMLSILASQVMVRVDEENKQILGWFRYLHNFNHILEVANEIQ